MSGGNNTSNETSRLNLPQDAVPMGTMSQSSSDDKTVTKDNETDKNHATNASPSTTAPAKSEPVDQAPAVAPVSPKGKEKESSAPAPPAKETTQDHDMAIGDSVDEIKAVTSSPDSGPVCNITLLLTSGSRHPYKIDAKYLGRRNVVMPDQTESGLPDPFSISIYTLKELILREWRSDWEAKPASPSSIRLIHFGKLLDDKEQLKKYQFSTESPNVVHMSIRPQDLDEEEPKAGSKSLGPNGSDGQRQRSGGCCVVL
ncbi:Fc.00g090160.m01.CDS01 [Cosmosporella sp. VM-42]